MSEIDPQDLEVAAKLRDQFEQYVWTSGVLADPESTQASETLVLMAAGFISDARQSGFRMGVEKAAEVADAMGLRGSDDYRHDEFCQEAYLNGCLEVAVAIRSLSPTDEEGN